MAEIITFPRVWRRGFSSGQAMANAPFRLLLEDLEEQERQARPRWQSAAELVDAICNSVRERHGHARAVS